MAKLKKLGNEKEVAAQGQVDHLDGDEEEEQVELVVDKAAKKRLERKERKEKKKTAEKALQDTKNNVKPQKKKVMKK